MTRYLQYSPVRTVLGYFQYTRVLRILAVLSNKINVLFCTVCTVPHGVSEFRSNPLINNIRTIYFVVLQYHTDYQRNKSISLFHFPIWEASRGARQVHGSPFIPTGLYSHYKVGAKSLCFVLFSSPRASPTPRRRTTAHCLKPRERTDWLTTLMHNTATAPGPWSLQLYRVFARSLVRSLPRDARALIMAFIWPMAFEY